jgi:hypothetical protein
MHKTLPSSIRPRSIAASLSALLSLTLISSAGGAPPGKGPAKGGAKPAPKAAPPPSHCKPGDPPVVMTPIDVDLKCNEQFQNCDSEITLTARNCSSSFQGFYKLEMFENGRRSLVLEFDPAPIVPPEKLWKESIPWTTPGEMEAVVYYHPPGETGEQSARTQVRVVNRKLEAAKAACEKCKGVWGRYGVNKYEGCNCQTADAGKECRDGDECQGECIYVRHDSEGREVGVCSPEQKLKGCVQIVMKGQSQLKPKIPPPRKIPTCFDN